MEDKWFGSDVVRGYLLTFDDGSKANYFTLSISVNNIFPGSGFKSFLNADFNLIYVNMAHVLMYEPQPIAINGMPLSYIVRGKPDTLDEQQLNFYKLFNKKEN